MLKLTAVVSLMLIGSTLWAAGLSCDSCGSECAAACGTRHFRSCCFNYLRRKRGPELGMRVKEFWPQPSRDSKDAMPNSVKVPIMFVENIPPMPEAWMPVPAEYRLHQIEDTPENRLQILYDA